MVDYDPYHRYDEQTYFNEPPRSMSHSAVIPKRSSYLYSKYDDGESDSRYDDRGSWRETESDDTESYTPYDSYARRHRDQSPETYGTSSRIPLPGSEQDRYRDSGSRSRSHSHGHKKRHHHHHSKHSKRSEDLSDDGHHHRSPAQRSSSAPFSHADTNRSGVYGSTPARSPQHRSRSTPQHYIPPHEAGSLLVRVVSGFDMPNGEAVGDSDPNIALATLPLITLSVGEEKHSTPVMSAAPSMAWDWTTRFRVPVVERDGARICVHSLVVAVFGNGKGTVSLGRDQFDLQHLVRGVPVQRNVQLRQGTLCFELIPEDFGLDHTPSCAPPPSTQHGGLSPNPYSTPAPNTPPAWPPATMPPQVNQEGYYMLPPKSQLPAYPSRQPESRQGTANSSVSPEHGIGSIKVKVVRASGLQAPSAPVPNPFVKVKIGDKSIETATKPTTADPIFNEAYTFYVRLRQLGPDPAVRVAVHSMDVIANDRTEHGVILIGSALLDLSEVRYAKNSEFEAHLKDATGAPRGKISLIVLPIDFGLEPPQQSLPTPQQQFLMNSPQQQPYPSQQQPYPSQQQYSQQHSPQNQAQFRDRSDSPPSYPQNHSPIPQHPQTTSPPRMRNPSPTPDGPQYHTQTSTASSSVYPQLHESSSSVTSGSPSAPPKTTKKSAEDLLIDQLKEELSLHQSHNAAIEERNSKELFPLQKELDEVRAQLQNATAKLERMRKHAKLAALKRNMGPQKKASDQRSPKKTPTSHVMSPNASPARSAASPSHKHTTPDATPTLRSQGRMSPTPGASSPAQRCTSPVHKTASPPHSRQASVQRNASPTFDRSHTPVSHGHDRAAPLPHIDGTPYYSIPSMAPKVVRTYYVDPKTGLELPPPEQMALMQSPRILTTGSYYIDPFTGQRLESLPDFQSTAQAVEAPEPVCRTYYIDPATGRQVESLQELRALHQSPSRERRSPTREQLSESVPRVFYVDPATGARMDEEEYMNRFAAPVAIPPPMEELPPPHEHSMDPFPSQVAAPSPVHAPEPKRPAPKKTKMPVKKRVPTKTGNVTPLSLYASAGQRAKRSQ